jgi:peptidyl-dipeptidase A
MYSNPDQDLNNLWWQLVEKYQLLKKPESRDEPDWASKIHVALYPAYYHNYMLGELLASQLYFYIITKVLKSDNLNSESFVDKPDVGEYLKNLFFSYGALYSWNELIVKSTGEKLTAKYYAQQFVAR